MISTHLRQLPDVVFLSVLFLAPTALAAFLFGLAAGKREVLADLTHRGQALRRLQQIGFPAGLIGGGVYAHASLEYPNTAYHLFAFGVDVLTAPLMAAAYAATVLRLASSGWGRRAVEVLSPAGRMSLTAYLTQSLAGALIFTGYGAAEAVTRAGGVAGVGRVGGAGLARPRDHRGGDRGVEQREEREAAALRPGRGAGPGPQGCIGSLHPSMIISP